VGKQPSNIRKKEKKERKKQEVLTTARSAISRESTVAGTTEGTRSSGSACGIRRTVVGPRGAIVDGYER